MTLGVEDVEAAAARIRSCVHRTPVLTSRNLDALAGAELALKAEHLQRAGSFKARGAFNALLLREGAPGVITVSSGNHGQALACAGGALGIAVTVIVPEGANPLKLAAMRSYGAEVVSGGVSADSREDALREEAARRSLPVVHPYDEPDVMAGQGTAGLELLDDAPGLDAVVVPVGGGGLLSGVATAVKGRSPGTAVVGVEPEGADDVRRSLEAGRRVALEGAPDTVCDGVRTLAPGGRPWAVIRERVDGVVTVSDRAAIEAMELLWTRTKTVVEPSGALPLAAVLGGHVPGQRIGLVCSGGNVDPATMPG